MAAQRTAPVRPLTEQRKARARLALLTLVALVCPPLAGIHSVPIWLCYVVFALLYSLWALRLSAYFSHDRRLGYLLCLTDVTVLLPLLVWSTSVALRAVLVALCASGLVASHFGRRREQRPARPVTGVSERNAHHERPGGEVDLGAPLERAVRVRLSVFRSTGSRFALVMLRVIRFEEIAAYYGEDSSRRVLAAISRRGLRLLGPDAQHFLLPGGRVAFLFELDSGWPPGLPGGTIADSKGPIDIESLAMAVGRRACEHLVDGQRVECVVGWASAPADGLNADDLMEVAEAGAQSTAAFRRAAGQVAVRERTRAAAG